MKNIDSPAQIEGEQKNVSVLFANIPEFTVTSEKSDSREVKNTKDKLFKAFIVIVYKYGGSVNKFIDNCMLTLFGAQIMHEDDPERAVYAGLDMMNAMEQFNEEHGTEFSLNVGINHGIVTVRSSISDSGRDYKDMGYTVNCAEQLMETAKDEILVSESVYKSTSYLFEMDTLKPVSVKRKTARILPYRVVGMKGKPGRKHGVPELFYPLMGRNKEFKVIKLALNKVIKGKSAVISINGEAGVGKSRLIEEFRKVTIDKVNWMSGRCLSYGKDFPFWVFLEQIRTYIGLRAFDLESESRRKVGGKAERLFKERKNEYLPYLCVFLSIKVLEHLQEKVKYLDPESLRLQEFVSVKALFRDIAKNKPLILYFENMQWIDPESLELLKFLLDGLKNVPIFFLFESRPEQEMESYNIRESLQKVSKKRYREIDLNPLSTNDAKRLIRSLLKTPELPRDISSLILEKSECNPFYVVEIVRSFIESGILKQDNGSWKLTKDVSSFEIPNTIEAVIRSRIDNLPLEEKDVLGRASVIGRSFLYRILSYLSKEDNLRKNLDYLEERGFILRKNGSSASRLSPDTEYIFSHILIRDVAYNGLLKKKKTKTHKKVAECIEDVFRDRIEDLYEMLAYHYHHAEILKNSYYYYKKAGDAAKEHYSNNIAIECYTKAIEIHKKMYGTKKKENLAGLYNKRGMVRTTKSDYDKALKDYSYAQKYYRNIEKKADIKRRIANIYCDLGKNDKSLSAFKDALQKLKVHKRSDVCAKTNIDYAFFLIESKGNIQKAENILKQVLKNLSTVRNKTYSEALNSFGLIAYRKGDFSQALRNFKKAFLISKSLNDKSRIAAASNNLGVIYYAKGNLSTAMKYYKEALQIWEDIGNLHYIGKSYRNIAKVYKRREEYKKALSFYKRSLTILNEIGNQQEIRTITRDIGDVYREKGDLDIALLHYREFFTIAEQTGHLMDITLAIESIGNTLVKKGELNKAMKYFKRYQILAQRIGSKYYLGFSHFYIGKVLFRKGKFDTALKHLLKSHSFLSDINDPDGIFYTSITVSNIYIEKKMLKKADKYLKNASQIFKKMDWKSLLLDILIARTELHIAKGEYESALATAKKLIPFVKKTESKTKKLYALRVLGKSQITKNIANAIQTLQQSVSIAKKFNMKLEMAISTYELAKILKNEGKVKEAKKHLKEANKIFKKSGADGWLKKANELMNDIEKE